MDGRLGIGFVLAAMVVAGGPAVAQEPDRPAASPYFDCPYVNYFDSDCPQLQEDEVRRRPRSDGDDAERRGERRTDERREDEDGEAGDGLSGGAAILFPRESMAPDTPALYRALLENPTLENARRYVLWHARRTARVALGQALIKQAGGELAAELAALSRGVERELQALTAGGR